MYKVGYMKIIEIFISAVVHAKAGIHIPEKSQYAALWIPAFAGMTGRG